jgi:hypothetical protein
MKEVFGTFTQLTKQTEDQKAGLIVDLAQVYDFTHLEDLTEEQRAELWALVKREVA